MDQNPQTSPDALDEHAANVMMDRAVDRWEDALADVSYYLEHYAGNVAKLVDAMVLATDADKVIKFLAEYIPDNRNTE